MDGYIDIEVVYAERERQWQVPMRVPAGTTVAAAIESSGLRLRIPALTVDRGSIGVFGRLVEPETPLRHGDRVEIYRPLLVDPKALRRARAQESNGRR
jgi:putative ubiquitin-RnfH superfamily antitoxin RatB of RatAB toxin-antitoxin module